jgi:hypothetical protein
MQFETQPSTTAPPAQIAELLATFSLGQERVQASVLLFMRCSDPRSGLDQVLGVLGSRDAEEWRRNLLWFGSYCFSFPQGELLAGLFKAPTAEAVVCFADTHQTMCRHMHCQVVRM